MAQRGPKATKKPDPPKTYSCSSCGKTGMSLDVYMHEARPRKVGEAHDGSKLT